MSDSDEETSGLVLDIGSARCRAGFAGDSKPRSYEQSVIGRPLCHEAALQLGCADGDTLIGDAAVSERNMLSLKYPIERGIVTDWDDMDKLLEHIIYKDLRVESTKEHNVLFSEATLNPKSCRERMTELFMEKYEAPSVLAQAQPVLALYGNGYFTGVSLDAGDGVTSVVPIFEGSIIPPGVQRLDFGGRDGTHYLMEALCRKGHQFQTSADLETARLMKEKMAYVAVDFDAEVNRLKALPEEVRECYKLPDGSQVALSDEGVRCAELLFNPSLFGAGSRRLPGIHQMVYDCIAACDLDCRRELWSSICVTGSNSMFRGTSERMKVELNKLQGGSESVPAYGLRLQAIFPPGRRSSVWDGGSVLASLTAYKGCGLSAAEYQEYGPGGIHCRSQYCTYASP